MLSRLQNGGFAAYAVGGCVRDSLLHKRPADWDVTTAAKPEQILSLFADHRTVSVGQQHGTIGVLTEIGVVEITTFRVEGDYSDSRRPDTVAFVTDVTADLARRDFTVNAMAYNEVEGVIDPFHGQEDLAARRLRCVGDAKARFSEDALRILRALRFASVLGFSIEDCTAKALHETGHLLQHIAVERVTAELTRLLCGQNVLAVLEEYRDILAVVLPEVAPMFDFEQRSPYHIYDVYRHTLHALAASPADPLIRWAVLLHDCGKPHTFTIDEAGVGHFKGHADVSVPLADGALKRLRLDNDTVCNVVELIKYHDRPIFPTAPAVKRVLNRLGEAQLRRLIEVKRADNAAHAPETDTRTADLLAVEKLMEEILAKAACFSLKDLAVKGDDITSIGVPKGPLVGKILGQLLEDVMDERCENERKALLTRVEAVRNEVEST